MNFDEWIAYGRRSGWCGPPVCATHDGVPTTEAEYDDFDLCHHVVRLYADKQQREAVEANHSPSLWRGANIPNPEESE